MEAMAVQLVSRPEAGFVRNAPSKAFVTYFSWLVDSSPAQIAPIEATRSLWSRNLWLPQGSSERDRVLPAPCMLPQKGAQVGTTPDGESHTGGSWASKCSAYLPHTRRQGMERIMLADWDNTMREGFTMADWTHFLSRRGRFPERLARAIDDDVEAYSSGAITYEDLATAVTVKYAQGLAGKAKKDIERVASEFVLEDRRLFIFVRPLVRLLQDEGVSLVLVSGSPREPLVAYRELLPINRIYALSVKASSGLYTDELALNPTLGEEKERIVRQIAKSAHIVLAMGDSKADLPLLEAAPHSIIVENPDLVPEGRHVVYRVSPKSDQFLAASVTSVVRRILKDGSRGNI